MKILRITAEGLPLFKEKLDISFFAQQRVAEDDKDQLYPLFSNIYMNCSNAFIGINAAGKTSILKVILFVLNLLNNDPINHIKTRDILGNTEKAVFNSFFYSKEGEICRLETVIRAEANEAKETAYKIVKETFWSKPQNTVTTKKNLTDFSACEPVFVRKDEDFLSDDVSIIIAYNKKTKAHMNVVSLLSFTNINILPFSDEIPEALISYLDPTVEMIRFEKNNEKTLTRLKFKGKEEILLNNSFELNQYLSSGTIKGIVTFKRAAEVLKTGGYLVIDEIENHFNKEIVSTLIRFFMDRQLNQNGGTLIFTTHYPELLDEYDRNDGIHIVRNRTGITVENLSNILKRNDIKKSEAYQSGFLEGTTPMYDAYMRLKKSIVASL